MRVKFTTTIDEKVLKGIKKAAVDQGVNVNDIVEKQLKKYLKKNDVTDLRKRLENMIEENNVVDIMPITIYKENEDLYIVTCDGDDEYVKEFNNAKDAAEEAFSQSNIYNLISYLIDKYDRKTDMIKELIRLRRTEEDELFGITLGVDDINNNTYLTPHVADTAWNIKNGC